MLTDARMLFGFVRGLRPFLRRPMSPRGCRERLADALRQRNASFLRLLEHGVVANERSPYRALLRHAGATLADVTAMVGDGGIEPALQRLRDAGVYLTLNEFKGRAPIRRGSLELPITPRQFDNPLSARQYEAATGGSRGARTRLTVDLDLLVQEAAHLRLFLEAFGLEDRAEAVWWTVPPGSAGMKNMLRRAKLGQPAVRWFSQYPMRWRRGHWKAALFTEIAMAASRVYGRPLARPEVVPLDEEIRVARWLEQMKRAGTPGMVATTVGAAVRVCLAASEQGLDISGGFFRVGGEAYTPARDRVVSDAGCRAAPFYSMAETGLIGLPCAEPEAVDEVHVLEDKMALITRPTDVSGSDRPVDALLHTTIFPMCPRILINVESGDYATASERRCGCGVERAGYARHLHSIRSYEKLTAEGVSFLGEELIELVEEVLPAQFGGHPTDYQIVEEEQGGIGRVSIIVSPSVGEVDEGRVLETVRRRLAAGRREGRMMATIWRDGETLRVRRRKPFATGVAKILPLHVERSGDGATEP